MKKLIFFTVWALVSVAVLFAGGRTSAENTLTIGATPVPHAELLNLIRQELSAAGINLVVREFNDYVQPNEALIAGDLDANFFQHVPYLQSNQNWNSRLAPAFGVHVEPLGLYSRRFRNITELPDGANIAIPNDPTNGGRALLLLQANGLITLSASAGLTATPRDITGNPRNFRFTELESAQLPRALGDVDAAVINGNFAMQAGLNPVRDSLIIEGADSPYVNVIVVRRGSENDPKIRALQTALLSQKVKDHIEASYGGGVVAAF